MDDNKHRERIPVPGESLPRYRVVTLDLDGQVLETLAFYHTIEEAAKHPRHLGKRFALMDQRTLIDWPQSVYETRAFRTRTRRE